MGFIKNHSCCIVLIIILIFFIPFYEFFIVRGFLAMKKSNPMYFMGMYIFFIVIIAIFPALYLDNKRKKKITEVQFEKSSNVCQNCGKELTQSSQFCRFCGSEIIAYDTNYSETELESETQIAMVSKEGKDSFIKIALQNPFSRIFVFFFIIFVFITMALSMFYYNNPIMIGIILVIVLPYFAGFFTFFLVIIVLLQNRKGKKIVDKHVFDKWNRFVIMWSIILFIIPVIWVIGLINMVIGFWVFVWFIVVGNMNSMIRKDSGIWAKFPANKILNLFLLGVMCAIPIVVFALNTRSSNVFFGFIIGYIAIGIIGVLCFVIIIIFNKEIGKRVALFGIFFVYTITVWAVKAVGSFQSSGGGGAGMELALEMPIFVITIYNIFSEVKDSVNTFDDTVDDQELEGPLYKLLSKFIDEDLLDALIFVFFCSAFFGYLMAKIVLTTISQTLSISLGTPVIDLGVLIPNTIQIIIALILVIPFLISNVMMLKKEELKTQMKKKKQILRPFQRD